MIVTVVASTSGTSQDQLLNGNSELDGNSVGQLEGDLVVMFVVCCLLVDLLYVSMWDGMVSTCIDIMCPMRMMMI
jgi:hypothetical protein